MAKYIDRQLARSWGYSDDEINQFMSQFPADQPTGGTGISLGAKPATAASTVPNLASYETDEEKRRKEEEAKRKKKQQAINLSGVAGGGTIQPVPGATALPQGTGNGDWFGSQVAGAVGGFFNPQPVSQVSSLDKRLQKELGG